MPRGQKKRPFSERHRYVRCPSVIYFAYLVKKFNLKILPASLSRGQPAKIRPPVLAPIGCTRLPLDVNFEEFC